MPTENKTAAPVTADEELDAVLQWRDKYANAIKERGALQLRLNTANQRNDMATSLIQRMVANFDTKIRYHEDIEPNDLEHGLVLSENARVLESTGW